MAAAPPNTAGTGNSDDAFRYPLMIGDLSVTLPNSISWIRDLNEECGRLPKARKQPSDAAPTPLVMDDVVASWFTTKTKVVPGDVLTVVDTFTFPTPRGMQTISRGKVEQLFDRRYLLEMEEPSVLRLYTYVELDYMRFAFTAMMDLIDSGKVYGKDGQLSGLAKRDIKKNCSPAAADPDPPAPAPTAVSAAPGSVQKHLRGILEDECAARWPHTPVSKSCIFKLEQDPKQPRHKPLFKATVDLPLLGGKVFTFAGIWAGNKRDAENAAADVALRMLLASKKK